ncbi:response regulator transcription factor [Chitinophagaceae bacterium LWZ2-11]
MKILIIEDEKELSASVAAYLKEQYYICEEAHDYASALDKIEMYDYDCILLDITLPGGNGLNLLKALKENNKVDGVLIISARNSLDDRIEGLQLGADDYLTKPFHLSELSARIAAIIRRKQFAGRPVLVHSFFSIDTVARAIKVNDIELELTQKEYQLLLFFVINKNRVLSKNAIAQHLWGDDMDYADNYDFIYTHIKNLRKKIVAAGGDDCIRSIYGEGYKMTL